MIGLINKLRSKTEYDWFNQTFSKERQNIIGLFDLIQKKRIGCGIGNTVSLFNRILVNALSIKYYEY